MKSPRFAPLTGVIFVVLLVIGFIPLGGDTPDTDASAAKIISFYSDHETKEILAIIAVALAALFLALFAVAIRDYLRDTGGGEFWPTVALVGAAIGVAGLFVAGGTHFALVDGANLSHGRTLSPDAMVALNALDNDNFIAFSVPLGIMLFGAAGAVLKGGAGAAEMDGLGRDRAGDLLLHPGRFLWLRADGHLDHHRQRDDVPAHQRDARGDRVVRSLSPALRSGRRAEILRPMPRRRREREPIETVDYTDPEGNVLTLRQSLSPRTIRKISKPHRRDASSAEDVWARRNELLFEYLVTRWEISGLPLDDQKMLIGRYRMADSGEKRGSARRSTATWSGSFPSSREQRSAPRTDDTHLSRRDGRLLPLCGPVGAAQGRGARDPPSKRSGPRGREPRLPDRPACGWGGRAPPPPDPRPRQEQPVGQAGPGPRPRRDGPDSDRALRGRFGCARERSSGAPRRLLHRRVPGGNDLGWPSAPGKERRRSARSRGFGGASRLRDRSRGPRRSRVSHDVRASAFASSSPPRARPIPPRARPGSRSGSWTSFAHWPLRSTRAATPPRRSRSTSASSPSARRVQRGAVPKRPTGKSLSSDSRRYAVARTRP